MTVSRRRFLTTGIAAAAASGTAAFGQSAAQKLTATTRSLDVNGKAARVYGLIGPGGKPGVTLGPGERFRVELVNATEVPTIVHWHGQTPPWKEDGFPWPQTPSLAAGTSRGYDFVPLAGTHWMHSHHGLQEQRLMTAPMIVRSAADYREDRQQVVVMLHDFSFVHRRRSSPISPIRPPPRRNVCRRGTRTCPRRRRRNLPPPPRRRAGRP